MNLNVTFPGNLAQVDTATDLRGVPSASVFNGILFIVKAVGGMFAYDPSSLQADDGTDVIKPVDKTTLQAGRWIRDYDGLGSGPAGATGASNNSRASLAALKAAATTDLTSLYDGSLWTWTLGDYSATPAGQLNLNVVKADSTALSVGAWIRQASTALTFKLPATASIARSAQDKLAEHISVADFGAKGDATTDDQPAIQAAINAAKNAAGGTVFFPRGVYRITRPIECESFVNLIGDSSGGDVSGKLNGVWLKKDGTVVSDASGVNCVLSAYQKRQFAVEGISVLGTSTATGVPTGERGVFVKECYDFTLRRMRADKCRGTGFELKTSYLCTLDRLTAMRCQDYGFDFNTSCTTITANNLLSWGTAGGYSLSGVTYSTFTGLACDYSDNPAGSFPGEGGQASPRAYIYRLSAVQGVTFVSPGCEGALSKWMYAEGVQITITSPNVASMTANEASWAFLEMRGTGYSNIAIINPYGFHGVVNTLSSGKALYAEMPEIQKLFVSGRWRLDNFAASNAYTNDAIFDVSQKTVLNLNQSTMIVGTANTPFLKQDPADIADVVNESGVKKLVIDAVAGAAQKFTIPIGVRRCFFAIQATGEYASGTGAAKLQLLDNTGAVLQTWTNSGGTFSLDERAYVDAGAGKTLSFVITTNNQADTMKFTRLRLTYVDGQI